MPELWFRGEGVGVVPATSGSTASHDLGDGMYLADTKEAAAAYARLRAADPRQQRVFQVPIAQGSLRILDLTADPRWQTHVAAVEPHIRGANENYGRTFENFVQTHKINLNDYDAVVGKDYVRGGKQMVILYRNGQPTDLHVQIRGGFRPLAATYGGSMSSDAIGSRAPRMWGSAFRVVGGMAALIGLELVAQWLFNLVDERLIETQMKWLEPQISKKIRDQATAIATLLAAKKKAFAVITVEVNARTVSQGGPPQQSFSTIRLFHIEIRPEAITTRNISNASDFGGAMLRKRFTYSAEVTLSQEEIDLFIALNIEHTFYQSMLKVFPGDKVARKELDRVRERILRTLGPKGSILWNLQMWPVFKYKSNY